MDAFHLCSLSELYSGAYHTARVQGWLRGNSQLWTRENDQDVDQLDPNIFKTSICCID